MHGIPTRFLWLRLLFALLISGAVRGGEPVTGKLQDGVLRVALLPPGPDNPRNSEGDFIRLNDGRLLLVYTHFTGGAGDHATAFLAGRYSTDQGQSWTAEDVVIVPNEATMNVMSVSLLRLADGRIALFYLRKNSRDDCRPTVRFSDDEAKTWSEPVEIIPRAQLGYYVLNNDRVVQLDDGRLLVPVAQHDGAGWDKWTANARISCYFSDDSGKTWKRGDPVPAALEKNGRSVIAQEPGLVALNDDRVMLWCRTNAGSQYVAHSKDRGVTWSQLKPSNMLSPLSPATLERIPSTDHLLLVWNDHRDAAASIRGKRTPLRVAISKDEGQTWTEARTLEDKPHGWYCYTAMAFVDDHVLLAHSAGDRRKNNGLAETQVTRFAIEWLYADTESSAD